MRTIRLKINNNVFDKIIWLLSKFDRSEVEVINEDDEYLETQKYLEEEYQEIAKGTANFVESEELENKLEETIGRHENRL